MQTHPHRQSVFSLLTLLILALVTATASAQDGLLPLPGDHSRAFGSETPLEANPTGANSLFGASVAVDNGRIVVGAQNMAGWGTAYVFEQDTSGTWNQQALTASDRIGGDEFGFSVAIQGDTIMVGARKQGDSDRGAVYVFTRSSTGVWTEQQRLQPVLNNFAYFGRDIAIDGDRAVIAASGIGAAFVYQRDTLGQWQFETQLPITVFDTYKVAIDGTRIAVSSLTEESYKGAVLILELVGGAWTQTATLLASDGVSYDYFGSSLALKGNQLFAGSPSRANGGAVYAFQWNSGVWTEQQMIIAADVATGDLFGNSLDFNQDRLMIGANGDSSSAGSVYQYTRSGSWTQSDKLEAIGGSFGVSVALGDEYLVVGASSFDNHGRAYVYTDAALAPLELLVDGGFESAGGVTGWDVKNATSDQVKCNKPEKVVAYEGNCTWRFKGGPGENAKIQQVITSGVSVGDTLELSGYVNASGAVDSKVKVTVAYSDGVTPKNKITVSINRETDDYLALDLIGSSMDTEIAAPIEKIKVMVKNSSSSGKVYYDALSLTAQ